MENAKLLDCTLRDGAYLIDKNFGDKAIHGIIAGLINANIDIIEVGFLQDEGTGEGKTVFNNSYDAQKYIPDNRGNSLFAVLADYSRYSVDNLDAFNHKSFDIIRACFFKNERKSVLDFCRKIKEKGYKLFVQPVDALGYSDEEMLDLINDVNAIEPYCFSIVDTFGSMYVEDLHHIYSLVDFNLNQDIRVGLHSHNNLQMSSALSQEFLRLTNGKRKAIVDGTISGMGRGAGNTPTELLAQYMVSKLHYSYDIDLLLDVIDGYMDNIRTRCEWGYSTPYFIAGSYSAHVNNITYLKEKNSIRSKDIRLILNEVGSVERKRYNYELLENTYLKCVRSDIDDAEDLGNLKSEFVGRNVVVIAPGTSANETGKIEQYVRDKQAISISINFIHSGFRTDYLYFSNVKRYAYWKNANEFSDYKKIITSNIDDANSMEHNNVIISFNRLIKCGWEHMDSSAIMILRLLDQLEVADIAIIGMDGYKCATLAEANYVNSEMALSHGTESVVKINEEIRSMLIDFINTRKGNGEISFLVPTRFSDVLESKK